jgi:chaperone required for assembly of F1-ATPase
MRDILYPEFGPAEPDPMRRAQAAMARQTLPKRFYKNAEIIESNELFELRLDGRQALTPGRKPLALPTKAAADLVASEWRAQTDVIDPARMHATRITNTAIDSMGARMAEVRADIGGYARSDLVCYRAGEPEGLIQLQNSAWNPVVAWSADAIGARMRLVEGIMHETQSDEALAAVEAAVAAEAQPIRLAALHVIATMSGSCLIALMVRAGAMSLEDAFAAAHVDEAWNVSLWGQDAEAEARQARRREEFLAAGALLAALQMPATTRLA